MSDKLSPLKVILATLDPDYSDDVLVEEALSDRKFMEKTMKLAKRNGLQYHFVNKLCEQINDVKFLDEGYWKQKEQGILDLKKTIELLNDASKESGISYILIKDCNTVPHIPRDVDIFTRLKEKECMIKALEGYGVKCEHSSNIDTTLLAESCLPIDLYTKIVYFGNEFFDEDFLFDSIEEKQIFDTQYPGLNSNAEFMLNSLHSLFGHSCLSLLDFLHLQQIKSSNLNVELCENYAKTMRWGDVFLLALENLALIHKGIYVEKEEKTFPYLYDTKFVMKCINRIDGIELSQSDKLLIGFSLFLDGVKLQLEGSLFYDMVKRCTPLKKALLSLGYGSRSIRGDRYS